MKISVLDGFTLNPGDNPWTGLESLGKVRVYDRTPPEEVVKRAHEADILVVNKVKLPKEILEQLPKLKMIAVTATGYDVVDTAAAKSQGIVVSNVPVYGTDSVAQHVMAFLLYFCHRVDLHGDAVRQGEWKAAGDFCFWKTPLVELAGKKIGIIGFGRIGRRIGELAHAFGMEVLAHTRTKNQPPDYKPFRWADLEQISTESDFVSLNCPLTPETKELVNQTFLNRMKPSAILINASRGPLVMEQDLCDALNTEVIAGAAVDVASTEPIEPDNPLLQAQNCLITPHNAWASVEARKRLMSTTVENVGGFIDGKPKNVVNS